MHYRKLFQNFVVFSIMLLPFLVGSLVFAVDSVSLKPDSDVTFTKEGDSKTMFVQVSPAEQGVLVIVDVDSNVAIASSSSLTTDEDGKAQFTLTPGPNADMSFLYVTAEGVESNYLIVKNEIQASSTVTITPEELRIYWQDNPNSSATITVNPPKITNLTINNDNPDIVSVGTALSTDSSGSAVLNIIANAEGTATITASLADGTVSNVLTVNVFVGTPITVTPEKINLKVNESFNITVSGGSGNYFWSAFDGTLSATNGAIVEWTAPDYPGVFSIKIKDSDQKQQEIIATVTAPLSLYPQEAYLIKGQQIELHATGGQPDYVFSVKDGTNIKIDNVADHPEFKLVTAPDATGEYSILVQDTLADQVESKIIVIDRMSLSRNEVEITNEADESDLTNLESVIINGGRPPYSIVIEKGDFKLKDNIIYIIPPLNNATYNMVIKDSLGDVGKVVVKTEIPGRLQIQPSNPEKSIGETQTFKAVGGTGPYTFISSDGTLIDNQDGTALLTIENTDSDIVVIVKDNTGACASANVKVLQGIHITPSETPVTLITGESKVLNITGGSGTYYYSTDFGLAQDMIEETSNGKVVFTAPQHSGTVKLTVSDTRDSQPATIEFNIVIASLAITPSIKYIDLASKGTEGSKETFEIIGDFNSMNLQVKVDFGSIVQKGDTILYTPPNIACTDTIHITSIPDEDHPLSQTATASVEILTGLTISPSVLYLDNTDQNAQKKFTVLGGAGGYRLKTVYGDLDKYFAESGESIIYFSPGLSLQDEVIEVLDKAGAKTSAIVRISNALQVTPKMVTLDLGQTYDHFQILNGVGPYTIVEAGGSHEDIGQGIFKYTAPNVAGEYKITVSDSAGNSCEAFVFVTNGLKITPLKAELRLGESTEIQALCGTGPYHFTADMGQLSDVVSEDGSVIYTAPMYIEGAEETIYVKAYDSTDMTVATEIKVKAAAKSSISANSEKFLEDDTLNVRLGIIGEGMADIYVALVTPNGSIWFLNESQKLVLVWDGATSTQLQSWITYKKNFDVSSISIEDAVFSLDDLKTEEALKDSKGVFYFCSLLVENGRDLFDIDGWIDDEVSLFMFDIK